MCFFTHVPCCMWMCARAQRLLGCCLDHCLVMELETLFLFIPPPAVTVVSGACSLNSGLWDTWRPVKYTNPSNYAECCYPVHTLDSCYGKQKMRWTFKKCSTFILLSYLQRIILYLFMHSNEGMVSV